MFKVDPHGLEKYSSVIHIYLVRLYSVFNQINADCSNKLFVDIAIGSRGIKPPENKKG